MKFEVAYEYEDYREAFKHAFSRQMWLWVIIVLAVWGSFSALVSFVPSAQPPIMQRWLGSRGIFLARSDADAGLQRFLLWMALFGSVWMIFIGMARNFFMRRHWKHQVSLQRPRTIEVSIEGVVVSDIHSTCQFTWPAFTRFAETRHLIVLYLSSISPIIIPKRCISDESQQKALLTLAGKLIQAPDAQKGFAVIAPQPVKAAA